ncbi:MAG TPA: glycosyltransferase family 2 protein [Adhaeribacter sp.]|nr:glycosyltransferase family 2 protein [Adhaeribacter sp.]
MQPLISLVIPVYNEEAMIPQLFGRCMAALSAVTENFEIICVDDGSKDRTLRLLADCHQQDKRFKVLVLSRNFGHQAAYTAGLNYAKGKYVAMMDGDLQDPPELLADMYNLLETDTVDVVYGKRTDRAEGFMKKLLIKTFHKVFKRFSNLQESDNVGNFSMLNRKALTAFLSLQEKNRYLPGLRFFIGFRQGFVEYARHDRSEGEAKMSFQRLFALALDAIFSFSDLPIKMCLYTGLSGVIIFFIAGVYTVGSKLIGVAPPGWSSQLLSMYFLGCIQLLFLGILGEYVFRIYRESQNRPIFLVQEFLED